MVLDHPDRIEVIWHHVGAYASEICVSSHSSTERTPVFEVPTTRLVNLAAISPAIVA